MTSQRVALGMLVGVLALALASCAAASQPPSQKPIPSTGVSPLVPPAAAIAVAPSPLPTPASAAKLALDFSLLRENGQTVRLSDYRDKSSVVLVFYRGQT
jgi:hypothetical protein